MTGRKPKLSVIAGNMHISNREKEARANGELKLTGCTAKLEAPEYLAPGAKAEWDRVVTLYRQTGLNIIDDRDGSLLAIYCINADIMQRAAARLQHEDLTITTGSGRVKPNPSIKIMQDAGAMAQRAAAQLYLDPMGRIKAGAATAVTGSGKSDMQRLIEARRAQREE